MYRLIVFVVVLNVESAFGQFNTQSLSRNSLSAGQARMQGFQQTGQLNSSAAMQRDASAFVGSSSSSIVNPRSRAGTTGTSSNGGFGTSGLGGFGTSGFGMGGMSGFGGMSPYGGMGRNSFGMSGMNGMGGMGGMNGTGRQGQGGAMGQQSARPRIRTKIVMSGPPTSLAPAITAQTRQFAARLAKLPSLNTDSARVTVVMEGTTAVLRGQAASERDRDLIARLAGLEPGIAEVKNELTVDPQAARDP